jgi:hypothetical protein
MSKEIAKAFAEQYDRYVSEGLIDPSSDPRPEFKRALASGIEWRRTRQKGCADAVESRRGADVRQPPPDAPVIAQLDLPGLDPIAESLQRGGDGVSASDDDSEPPRSDARDDVDDADGPNLLPEPPSLGGWFVNKRQSLTPNARTDDGAASALARDALQSKEGDSPGPAAASWPLWLR